uniref:Uncharacterized protein n=1 Tax=Physcomitrium patens TaxID=3218 RepID=A0A2K1JYY2_PHYPA|nr:hypothetical protein PHYPA_013853 [Physcomitrium patens]
MQCISKLYPKHKYVNVTFDKTQSDCVEVEAVDTMGFKSRIDSNTWNGASRKTLEAEIENKRLRIGGEGGANLQQQSERGKGGIEAKQ